MMAPLVGLFLSGGFFLKDAIEDAVDKGRRASGAISLRQFHSLVDRNSTRRISEEDLEGANPQNIAIGRRHSGEAPVVGLGGQNLVEFWPIAADAGEHATGELHQRRIMSQSASQKLVRFMQVVRRVEVILIKNLQHNLASAATSRHRSVLPRMNAAGMPRVNPQYTKRPIFGGEAKAAFGWVNGVSFPFVFGLVVTK
jgi:hypothetical protein